MLPKPYYDHAGITIYHADCREILPYLEKVDLVLTDPPYGTTKNQWDTIIPFEEIWSGLESISKDSTVIGLFGQGMFTAEAMQSNKNMWRYNLVWQKGERSSGFLNAHKMPLRCHEDIMIFYKSYSVYNPQFSHGEPTHKRGKGNETNNNYGKFKVIPERRYGNKKFPKSIIKFDRPHPPIHPTQKPVSLLQYLINTYSNNNHTILDPFMGSGTTLVAAKQLNRKAIGIEIEEKYCRIAVQRLAQEVLPL